MLPIIIGGLTGVAITAIAMSDENTSNDHEEPQSPEEPMEEKTASDTIKEFRDQIDEILTDFQAL